MFLLRSGRDFFKKGEKRGKDSRPRRFAGGDASASVSAAKTADYTGYKNF